MEYSDMPLGHAWTLWQRMPPRYQLTSRCFEEFPDPAVVNNSSDNTGSPRLYPSPRAQSASARGETSNATALSGQESDSHHAHANKENKPEKFRQRSSQTASFPQRKSDYVSHFQTQRRVSSARRWLAEAPPQPAIHGPVGKISLIAKNSRAQTAPSFPITNPEFHEEQRRKRDIERYIQDNNRIQNSRERTRYKTESKADVFHFDDSKSIRSVDLANDSDGVSKKYMVQETNDAIMYVDNGKVNYFKKSRHDLTNLLKTQSLRGDRGNCFLAELRRDYLKHPKYGHKVPSDKIYKQSLTDPRVIASERVNYNNRLERILNYYSDKDSSLGRSSPNRSRPSSGRASPIKGLSLTGVPSRPPSPDSPPKLGRPDSPNDFIKMHKRSKLHNRQFYLRTPSQQHTFSTKEFESCRCYMCRVELQLALVTGISSDLALAATKTKTSKSDSLNGNFVLKRGHSEGKARIAQSNQQISQDMNAKQTASRVTFHQPEVTSSHVTENPKEHTLTISCTLPEMTDLAMSDSGLDTARLSEIATPVN